MNTCPAWLHLAAWIYLALCFACAALIGFEEVTNARKMKIMNLVWPITALYFGPIALWLFWRTKLIAVKGVPQPTEGVRKQLMDENPTREQVSTAVFHCGAGCTLGDIIGETTLFLVGGATFVAGSDFATKLVVDFLLAYSLGIFFQYFTIVPMRSLSFVKGITAAVRADTISIVAFEIGMFGWMALTRYVLFPDPRRIHPNLAVFWFMMQLAMIVGCTTAYPANLWLLKHR